MTITQPRKRLSATRILRRPFRCDAILNSDHVGPTFRHRQLHRGYDERSGAWEIATQSSTLGGFGASTAASSAVDGNTDGNFDGSVSHTNVDSQLLVAGGSGCTATIGSVVIWNRMDCCSDRLSDYWVFVSNTAFQRVTLRRRCKAGQARGAAIRQLSPILRAQSR